MTMMHHLPRPHAPTGSLGLGLLAAAALAHSALATEPDWSRFRGPNGVGVADAAGLPDHLDPTDASWRVETPPGYSSPVLSGDRLFLTGHDEGTLLLLCYNRHTGEELWRRAAPRTRNEKLDERNDPASPSAATDGEVVVTFFGDFGMVAWDVSGKELWRVPLGPFNNLYGMGASPVVSGETVLLAADQHTDSYLLAVDRMSGAVLWRVERPEARTGHSTPSLYTPAGGRPQIILPGSFFLTSYDLETGEKLWWVRGLSFEMKSVPVIGDRLIFVNGYGSQLNEPGAERSMKTWPEASDAWDANRDGSLSREELAGDELASGWFDFNDLDKSGAMDEAEWVYFRDSLATRNNVMAVRLPDAAARGDLTSSHIAWQHFRSVPQLPSTLLYRGVLYMIDDRGITTTFEAESGEVVAHGRIKETVDSFYSSPVAGDGKIYLFGRSGKAAILPADGSLEPLWTGDLDDLIVTTPALAPGRLYLRTRRALWAFGRGAAAPARGSAGGGS